MPVCEVCSKEPSKYKCPTCGLLSCSLGCTKSHKIYCAPKQDPAAEDSAENAQPEDPGNLAKQEDNTTQSKEQEPLPKAEIQKLFAEYPNLRSRLREIYKTTLEEEWNATAPDSKHSTYHRGDRQAHNHHHHHNNNRGTWTAEKGFNRGVAKIRRWREGCEGGECTDADAEGFVKFMALVAGERGG
ncbi:HIT finger domain protein, putative [Talaromyces stipitatus ATCC 10500]|uniref:HIT finger domain protein, putative n=1 Tax=Talaromyces stipitatus (strain ATCC 10500 / CBS 375.48 / QM 6759 / NRRL 1006) TaxID=441959 RepID=B8MGM4_TALSN|nr:HIT finger domain protein, putative [Talaromyces stipitatus ATCC 10500]EED16775.1 HIT finger domain protein, putative [Talaromyces stipitatus ATCC 10500]